MAPTGSVTDFALPPGNQTLRPTEGPDGNVWFAGGVCATGGGYIGRITATGNITQFPTDDATQSPATGPDGRIWFLTQNTNQIGNVTTSGSFTFYNIPTPNSTIDGGAVTAGPDGNVWFTEWDGNRVGRITTSGVITEFPIPSPNAGADLIAVGPDKNLWFVENGTNSIGRVKPGTGSITEFPLPAGCTDINSAGTGIAWAPNHKLYFTCPLSNQIGQMTRSGKVKTYPVPTPNSVPTGIIVGSDRSIWFTEFATSKIGVFQLPIGGGSGGTDDEND